MSPSPPNERLRERSLLVALLALLLFASPLTLWWAAEGAHWLLPYLLWLAIILLAGVLHLRFGRRGDEGP